MDPFEGSHSPADWWNEADFLQFEPELEPATVTDLSPFFPPHSPCLLPLSDPVPPKSSRRHKQHLRLNSKETHLRTPALPCSRLYDPVEEVLACPQSPFSEVDSVASTAKSLSAGSSLWLFKSGERPDECVEGVESCLGNGDLELCTAKEKRRILQEMRGRLRKLEGGVESLRASLRNIIKYKL